MEIFTARYYVITQYLGVTQDETMAVEISQHQFSICQETNGQFCNIYAPHQPLVNPPSCITTLYTKNVASISNRCSPTGQQNLKHQYTLTASPKCVDNDFNTFYSDNHHNPHLPKRNQKIVLQ